MTRCLVLIRSHEPLQEGWRKRSFGPAGRLVEERVKVGGVWFDETCSAPRLSLKADRRSRRNPGFLRSAVESESPFPRSPTRARTTNRKPTKQNLLHAA